MAISKKTFLGVALETTPGTPVLTPVRYIPCKSDMKGLRKPDYSDEDRYSRDKNFAVIYGARTGSLGVKGRWFNDACADFLYGIMGGYSVAQPDATHVPTVYKHSFTLADVPPTFTFIKGYQTKQYTCSFAAVEKFSLKLSSEKALEFDANILCKHPANLGTPVTPAFTTVRQFPGYAPTFNLTTLGSATGDIIEFDVEISQKLELFQPANGQPDYTAVYFGEREVKLGFTARFDLSTLYDNWIATTDDSLVFDIQGDLIANSGGSGTPPNTNYFQELNLNFPLINYDSLEHDEGKTNVMVKAKCTARPKADLSQLPFTAFIQNTVSTYNLG